MKKVLLISYDYPPFKQGGLARYSESLVKELSKSKKYEWTLVIAVQKKEKINLPKINNLKCFGVPVKFFNNPLLSYLEFSKKVFHRFIKNDKYDIVHSLNTQSYFFIPKPKNALFVVTEHNTFYSQLKMAYGNGFVDKTLRKMFNRLLISWEKKLCRMSDKIVSISDSTKYELIKFYNLPEDKISVVYNGIDLKKFKIKKSKKKNLNQLIFVGRIVPRKNVLDLITIMNLIKKQKPQVKLLIVGSGDSTYETKVKQNITKLGLEKNISMVGQITDTELNKLYSSSSIFVFTSLVEGFGLVLLEAMTKGLPIIAYDIPGVRDVVRNSKEGFLVEVNNTECFANKIKELITNKNLYERISKNSFKRVKDFSWKLASKEIINIYCKGLK